MTKKNILIIIVILVFAIAGAAYTGLLPLPGGGEQTAAGEEQTAADEKQAASGEEQEITDSEQADVDEEQTVTGEEQTGGDGQADVSDKPEETANNSKDLVIRITDITEDAKFIAYDGLDTEMEIIAVKASDGTVRTAFNTCQVCYSSGRGYYKQEGGRLVCQNCGNSFGMDDVEVTKGGCNPFPITSDYKTETADTVTIPGEFLEAAQVIFENWKI